ncbi:MAG: hypothetical protein IJB25_14150 [Clostridia bacterium]|nr:hypothetical protein [Clostridia bacterium]MBQ3231539.1 hypothetical protein [Clostridia bacterium]MBQ4621003.1 hypothetical protein [Clostridia bacterium]MBQ9856369.1 hypothetical protein [Clostridia bacterium]
MIQVIAGHKGSGKTKRLIDIANEALKVEHGIIAFIDDDKRYIYDLRHEIRFVDASDYTAVKGCEADVFFGFLSGMLAVNYDLSLVCIDAFLKLVKTPIAQMASFFERLNALSESSKCSFVINISCDTEDLPEFIKPYVI